MSQSTDTPIVAFGPFQLDRANALLARDGQPIDLTPKALDVLAHLAARPDRLVTKEELLASVWRDPLASDASIKVCVAEIRKALDDDPQSPRYIQTVHRRGYRFIAEIEPPSGAARVPCPDPREQSLAAQPTPSGGSEHAAFGADSTLVGRTRELQLLQDCLARATTGHRHIAFIIAPPGTGKTALVEEFLRTLHPLPTIAIGHCFEHFGAAEPYLPIWEALARLNPTLTAQQRPQIAPGSPGEHSPTETTATNPTTTPTTTTEPRRPSNRLLRDLADNIDSLAATTPLVLVLEDLHWADYSTLDLLSLLLRRPTPARLLIIATYRPGESPDREQPLRALAQQLRHRCTELDLTPLDLPAITEYLARRLTTSPATDDLATQLLHRTGGHPLFLRSLVDDLLEGKPLGPDIPPDIKAVIQTQFDRLSEDERRILEAAAVAGIEFSAAAAAAALGHDQDVVAAETLCETLARRHRFLQSAGVADWPDGTLATKYRFVHELYHNVVTANIPAARLAQMHRALATRLESAWSIGARQNEIATQLAVHYERGRDFAKALHYLRQCADHAATQYAHREAADYLRRAVAALDRLPVAARTSRELPLLSSLAVHLQVTQGFAAPEVHTVHARAYELCKHNPDTAATFPVLWGIWLAHKVRSDLRQATQLADQLLDIARQSNDPALLLQAYQAISVTSLCIGDPRRACQQIDRAAAIYDPTRHAANTNLFGQDPCVASTAFGAVALWLTGHADAALAASRRAIDLANQLAQPSSIALAHHFASMLHQLRGDARAVHKYATTVINLAQAEGFTFWLAGGTILQGWAAATTDTDDPTAAIAQIRAGINAWLATGSRTYHTYHLGLLADALLRHDRPEEALPVVEEALQAAQNLPEGIYEARLHYLKARCLLLMDGPSNRQAARESLTRARNIARAQGATAFDDTPHPQRPMPSTKILIPTTHV